MTQLEIGFRLVAANSKKVVFLAKLTDTKMQSSNLYNLQERRKGYQILRRSPVSNS